MEKLSEAEIAEFREIFNLVDKDGGGTISKGELGELMDTLGIDTTSDEIDLMMEEIDEDGTGELSFEDFVNVMSRKVNASYTSTQVQKAFRLFQGNAPNGFIKAEALIDALRTYGSERLSEAQARDLVSQLEIDQNGFINYDDYVKMMMSS